MEADSEDIESIFFAEGKMENLEENRPQDVEDLDMVNVEEITTTKHEDVEKNKKTKKNEHNNENSPKDEADTKGKIKEQIPGKSGKDQTINKDINKDETVDDFLDIILGNDKVEKRKAPPPRRTAKTSPYRESDRRKERKKLRRKDENELFKSVFSQKRSSQRDSGSQNSLSSDLDDIYNDPTKWKRNKPSPRASESINTIIMDDSENYEQLFKSGKMKKKTR